MVPCQYQQNRCHNRWTWLFVVTNLLTEIIWVNNDITFFLAFIINCCMEDWNTVFGQSVTKTQTMLGKILKGTAIVLKLICKNTLTHKFWECSPLLVYLGALHEIQCANFSYILRKYQRKQLQEKSVRIQITRASSQRNKIQISFSDI